MSAIRVVPASAAPWSDVERSLTGGGDGASCWCQWFPIARAEYDALSREQRSQRLRNELETTAPSPALVVYVDDAAAGWVRVTPRATQARLVRTRVVRAGSAEPLDDADVWAITCLVVRREHRSRGLAKKLVAAAVDHAIAHGARVIEAYPIDTDRRAASNSELFVGSVKLFEEQGFAITARPTEVRAVMTRSVRSAMRA